MSQRIDHLMQRADINTTDVMLAGLFGWFGLWMVIPSSTLSQSATYAPMFEVARPAIWGAVMLGLLLLKSVAMWRCWWYVRVGVLIAKVSFWSFLAVQIYVISPHGPSWGLLGIVAVLAFWRMLQLAATGARLQRACEYHGKETPSE